MDSFEIHSLTFKKLSRKLNLNKKFTEYRVSGPTKPIANRNVQ